MSRARLRLAPPLLAAAMACSGGEVPLAAPAQPAGPDAAPPGAEAALPAELAPEDPERALAEADLEERRARFGALREAFRTGAGEAPRAAARLEAALRATPPAPGVRWQLACRGAACRVLAAAPAAAWHPLLAPGTAADAIADRISADPDRRDPAVYLLVAPEGAGSGELVLDDLERRLRSSPEVNACAAGAGGPIALELRVDGSGVTWRRGAGELPAAASRCLADALGDLLLQVSPPAATRSAARTVVLLR